MFSLKKNNKQRFLLNATSFHFDMHTVFMSGVIQITPLILQTELWYSASVTTWREPQISVALQITGVTLGNHSQSTVVMPCAKYLSYPI